MNISKASGDMLEMELRQMGCTKINKVSGQLFFVKFELENDVCISYSYNINHKNQFFLQRISPYPLPEGVFSSQFEVISFIDRDIKKFKNAVNSKNFNSFISIANIFNEVEHDLESLFLNYNVDKDVLDSLKEQVIELKDKIRKQKDKSVHILLTSEENT